MPLNVEDVDVLEAERDADPQRFRSVDPTDHLSQTWSRMHPPGRTTPGRTTPGRTTPGRTASGRATPAPPPLPPPPRREPVEEYEEYESEETDTPPLRLNTRSQSYASASSINSARRPSARQRQSSMASATTARSSNIELKFMHYLDRHPTAVKRMQDHRLQHSATVGSRRSMPSTVPDFGGNKPYPPPLPDREEYVTEFSGHDDPRHAQNWPMRKKLVICGVIIWNSLCSTFASSVFSPASGRISEYFNVGREVATLTLSLFVLGYAFGPIVWGPLSELYGRKVPLMIGAFGFSIFETGVAVAKDLQTVMICRFFAGVFGSCALALTPAIMADIFDNKSRGIGISVFSASVMNGPFTAPFIGGFIVKSYLGWRWTAYLPAIMGYAAVVVTVFFLEETYGPVILVAKAAELRRMTRNWGIHAKQEEVEVDLKELAVKNVSRPMRILFTEPICLMVTAYMSFIYGLLYLCLTAYQIVFGTVHGWSLGVSGLPYIGLICGVFVGLTYIILMNKSYVRKLEANNNIPVPEWRMPDVMIGSILFTMGLFWFGWTGFTASISWIAPAFAGGFIGCGMLLVFLQSLNYIIDAYLMFAASASAANTFMRSICGAVFPLFATYMFEGIGVQWGMTLLGCVSALFIPMPFIFYFFGKKIRAKSKIAPAPDIAMDKKKDEESRGTSDDDEKKDD